MTDMNAITSLITDTETFRQKVIDAGIRGKLTERLPEDGDAEELYRQIQAEKSNLVKEGKIKKSKPLPAIKPEEVPFEIPENWKWVRFGELMWNRDSERVPVSVADRRKQKKKYDYYGASGIIDKVESYLFDERLLLISEDGANLLSRNLPIAFIAEGQYWVNNHAHVLGYFAYDYLDFVSYYINSISVTHYVTGSAQPKLNQDNMNKIPVPLPPISEQRRIISTIEEILNRQHSILTSIEVYSSNVDTLKSKAIDAGIQGKLTEQLPEDGNADDLFNQIQEEKNKLITEGKIKKSKPLSPIKPEEIPFEIPKNWKWVRLGDVFDHNTGKALNSSDNEGTLLTYITTSNVYWEHFELNNLKSMYFSDGDIDKCTIKKGDLLICEGGDIGRSAIWPYEQEMRIQNHLHRLRPFLTGTIVRYYYYVMWSYKINGLINGRGIGLQGFSSKRVHTLIVPLPTLAEQKRIANRIDDILSELD